MKLLMLLFTDVGANAIISGLVILGFAVLLFILLREFFCWYYKINAGLKELREINANIKEMIRLQGGTPQENKK